MLLVAAFLTFAGAANAFADELSDLQDKAKEAESQYQAATGRVGELQQQVEKTADDYNAATERVEELQKQIDDTQARIDEITRQMPAQQTRSANSMKTLYLMQNERLGMIEALIGSESLDDFLSSFEYMDCINSHNVAQMQKLQALKSELDDKEAKLKEDSAQAHMEAEKASEALTEAQSAREAAQAEAIAFAEQQAQAESAAAELAERERAAKEALAKTGKSDGVDASNSAAEQPSSNDVEQYSGTVSSGDVSWSGDRDAFVAQWAPRIDAYLSGSPMAGQGSTFAQAAWDSGVDPRWSPAIATVESSTGAICFMPYNAWGWGSYSFSSWEEAIPAHVSYLGGMYGSTITPQAASIYCPPNASFWYNRCLEEMSTI